MMKFGTGAKPTPEDTIKAVGCDCAVDIDQCLLDTADTEFYRGEEDGPQDLERAFNCLRAILMRHWDNPEPKVQKFVAAALMRRGQIMAQGGNIEQALTDYDEVWVRYSGSEDPKVRKQVAAALLEAGQLEERQCNLVAAEKWYELTGRYADDADPMTQYQVVQAQCNAADIYIDRGWLDPAFEKINALIARWSEHTEYWIRRRIANLMVNKAVGVKEDDERCAEALRLFDEAISYADRAVDPPAFFIQAGARLSKAHCFERLEDYEEAIKYVDSFENWMQECVRPRPDYVKKTNSGAESSLRSAFLLKSRCLHELGRYHQALAAFDSAGVGYDDLVEDMQKRERACNDLVRRGLILIGLGRYDEAETLRKEIFARSFRFPDPKVSISMIMSLGHLGKCIEQRTLEPEWLTTPTGGSPDPS